MSSPFGGFMEINQEQLEEEVRKAHAEAHNEMDRIRNLITDSNLPTTRALAEMLDDIINSSIKLDSGIPAKAAYYQGQVHLMLKIKHNVCLCGRDHAQEMLESLGMPSGGAGDDEPEQYSSVVPVRASRTPQLRPEVRAEVEAAALKKRAEEIEAERQAYLEDLKTYRVRDAILQEQDPGAVYCTDCGMRYPSLADRKLRPPDTCHGCQQRAAFG